jgi:hypothetical protein
MHILDTEHESKRNLLKRNSAEEPMEAIIQARYTNFATDDQDYPNMAFIARKVLVTN